MEGALRGWAWDEETVGVTAGGRGGKKERGVRKEETPPECRSSRKHFCFPSEGEKSLVGETCRKPGVPCPRTLPMLDMMSTEGLKDASAAFPQGLSPHAG